MLIGCNVPYVLKVDGVEWSPIGTREGKDEYVVSSGGFFEILVDDERVFFFRNEITQDFTHSSNNVRLYEGGVGGTTVKTIRGESSYAQGQFVECDYIRVAISGLNKSVEEVSALVATSSTGTASVSTFEGGVFVAITGFDINSYLQIKLGNVLVAFLLPV